MFNTLSLFNGSVNVAAFPSSKGKKLDFIKSKLFLSSSAVKLMETCKEISHFVSLRNRQLTVMFVKVFQDK